MSHRYKHVTNIRELNDEMLKLKLKKQIIRREFTDNVHTVRRSFFKGGNIISLIADLFSGGAPSDDEMHDKFDTAVEYTGIAAQLLTIINAMRK